AEALAHIGDEARLAELAVVDDVDAEVGLPAHDLADGEPQPGLERLLVDPLAAGARPHHVEQVARPRQAARMRGEDAVGAALHWRPSGPRREMGCGAGLHSSPTGAPDSPSRGVNPESRSFIRLAVSQRIAAGIAPEGLQQHAIEAELARLAELLDAN